MVQRNQSHHRLSWLWVLLALFAASVEPVIVKLGYRGNISPWQLLAFKNIVAALVILPLTRSARLVSVQVLFKVLPLSLLLLTTNALVLFALKKISVVTVVTMISTTPAFVAVVNHFKGRDQLSTRFWLGFGLCFLGILLAIDATALSQHNLEISGLLCMVGAVLSSTSYRTQMETSTKILAPKVISTAIFITNAAISSLLILPWCQAPKLSDAPLYLWIGVAAALANFAFLTALHLVGSTRMSIFDMLQRPMVIVFAAILLEDPISPLQVLGVLLVLLGVQLAKVKRAVKVATLDSVKPGAVHSAPNISEAKATSS